MLTLLLNWLNFLPCWNGYRRARIDEERDDHKGDLLLAEEGSPETSGPDGESSLAKEDERDLKGRGGIAAFTTEANDRGAIVVFSREAGLRGFKAFMSDCKASKCA